MPRRNDFLAAKARAYKLWVKALLGVDRQKLGTPEYRAALATALACERAFLAVTLDNATVADLATGSLRKGSRTKGTPLQPATTVNNPPATSHTVVESPHGTPMGSAHRDSARQQPVAQPATGQPSLGDWILPGEPDDDSGGPSGEAR